MKKFWMSMLAYFAVSEFKVDDKPGLTDDQRAEMNTVFGEEMTKKFEAYLADTDAASAGSDIGADIVLGLNAKHKADTEKLKADLLKATNEKSALQAAIAKLSAEEEIDAPAAVTSNAGTPLIKGIKTSLGHYQAVNHFIKTGRMGEVEAAASTIDVSNLNDEFGTYLSQNQNNLEEVKAIFTGFSSAKYFSSAMGTTEWRATQALITSVSQQFKNKWTPSGKSTFNPLVIKNFRHKLNVPIIPSEVLEGYMLHMYDEGLSVDQMPITKYIWQQLVLPQLLQDIELRMIFKGKYVDAGVVAENAAGSAPEDSMDGIETQLVTGLTTGAKFNYFDGDGFDFLTATDQEILTFVQDFTGWLAPVFRTQQMAIACSYEFWRRYKIAYKNIWGSGSGTSDPNFGGDRIDFSNQTLVPMEGMYGSPILFATPSVNLKKLRHKNDVPSVINDVQKINYEARIFGEYWLGAGFGYAEAVFAYVPTGYNPKALVTSVYGAHTSIQQNKGTDPAKSVAPSAPSAPSGSGSSGGI